MKKLILFIKIVIVIGMSGITNPDNKVFSQITDKPALIIIDIQNAIFPVYNQSIFMQNVNSLITKADLDDVLKVYIQFNDNGSFQYGSYGWQFHDDLLINIDDIVIQKFYQSSFLGTCLDSLLAANEISSIYISGLQSHHCVKQTCLGGLNLEYDVFLVEDAHSNKGPSALNIINTVNDEMENAGCTLIETSDVNFTSVLIDEKSENHLDITVYPNPFNTKATISFTLNQTSSVILNVFDLMGKEVLSLLNHTLCSAGIHSVDIDAHTLNSGIYFYQLKTNNGITELGKMYIVK